MGVQELSEILQIRGVAYLVAFAKSPEDLEADGHPNVARLMREDGISRQIVLRRPSGSRFYVTREVVVRLPATGRELGRNYSEPVAI